MLPRLATLAVFTMLLQASWAECDFVKVIMDRAYGYVTEIKYENYQKIEDVPVKNINKNCYGGHSILVGTLYYDSIEEVGTKNDNSLCTRVKKKYKDEEYWYLPRTRIVTEGSEMEDLVEYGVDHFDFDEKSVWCCKDQTSGDDKECTFMRIVNDFTNKKCYELLSVKYLSGVDIKLKKIKVVEGHKKSDFNVARIREIKYLDPETKKPVKYFGKVKIAPPPKDITF